MNSTKTPTTYEIVPDNANPALAEEWAVYATDHNCHARRVAVTTNKAEAEAVLAGLTTFPLLLSELRRTREWVAQYLNVPGHDAASAYKIAAIDAVIAKAEVRA